MACQCSINYCGGCRNKIGCSKYILYLEQIVTSPISSKSPDIASSLSFDPVITALSDDIANQIQGLTSTLISQYINIDNKLDNIIKSSIQIESALAEVSNKSNENTSVEEDYREDDSTEDLIINNSNDIVLYNGESHLKKGDKYFEPKKTIFGGTKMVEKTIK